MDEKTGHDALKAEIDRRHFARAVLTATALGVPEEELRDLRLKALWQIAAEYRNPWGTKSLAQQYGLFKEEVGEWLGKTVAREAGRKVKALEPCYDHSTGKYLSFEEWLDRLLKQWDRISVPENR